VVPSQEAFSTATATASSTRRLSPGQYRRKIYFADRDTDKIQRSNLDGTDVEDVITTGLADPTGVALDPVAGFIYFTDFGNNNIKRANLDGSGVVTLVSGLTGDPTDIALDLAGGKMYWPEFLGAGSSGQPRTSIESDQPGIPGVRGTPRPARR
jgi:DNA-binding beta-propeller fold protein YncE